ncbi:MAG: hypothetical protein CMM96_01375 [Rickettsiales bacterium]|nr:hypothetical protein [Rickettsiales bacterium]
MKNKLIKSIKKIFNPLKRDNFKEAIEDLIEEQEVSDEKLDAGTKKIFSNVIDIRNKCVEDVMVPRADISAISEDSFMDSLMKIMSKTKHSRIPTYSENLDKITGMIHIRDFLSLLNTFDRREIKKKKIKDISRKILFTSPSMKILDLLLKMRSEKIHMSVVVDEYGGTDGLVTIEDLVEEIVGEIEDEHDMVQRLYFKKLKKNSYEVSARMLINEFEKKIKKTIIFDEKDKIDTLGGLVFSLAERIPERGEIIKYEQQNMEFNVVEADTRKIKKIVIHFK